MMQKMQDLFTEESPLCLADHGSHAHILRYTPREAQFRPGRSFILPQETRSLETDHGSCEDMSNKCAFRNVSMALSTMNSIWMGACLVFQRETWWELIRHLARCSGTLQVFRGVKCALLLIE